MTAAAHEADAGRRATWFELFFDLVFVAGVARLSAALAEDFSPGGLARFGGLFLVLWWCWVSHTFYATRFDQDTVAQRLLGLCKVAAVVLIAFAAPVPWAAMGPPSASGSRPSSCCWSWPTSPHRGPRPGMRAAWRGSTR